MKEAMIGPSQGAIVVQLMNFEVNVLRLPAIRFFVSGDRIIPLRIDNSLRESKQMISVRDLVLASAIILGPLNLTLTMGFSNLDFLRCVRHRVKATTIALARVHCVFDS